MFGMSAFAALCHMLGISALAALVLAVGRDGCFAAACLGLHCSIVRIEIQILREILILAAFPRILNWQLMAGRVGISALAALVRAVGRGGCFASRLALPILQLSAAGARARHSPSEQ